MSYKISKYVNWDYLLFYRFLGINLVGCIGLWIAYLNNWVTMVIQADVSQIVFIIFGMFVVGTLICGYKVFEISRETNKVRKGQFGKYRDYIVNLKSNQHLAEALKLKVVGKVLFVRLLASILVSLGLIGTIVGFIMVMGSIPEVAGAGEAAQMVSVLGKGMGVALYTTLIGSIFNIWARFNYQILATGSTNLVSEILKAKPNIK